MSYSQALEEQLKTQRYFREHGAKLTAQAGESFGLLVMVAHSLSHGDPYYWSPDICSVMEQVASSVPDAARLAHEDLPSDAGFFLFARPIVVGVEDILDYPDVYDHRREFRIEALSWGRVESADGSVGVGVCGYERADCGCLGATQLTSIWPPLTLGEYLKDIIENGGSPMPAVEGCAKLARLLYACLAFIRDHIITSAPRLAARPTRKRLERAGFTHEPLIRVVELRRKQSRSEHHDDRDPVEWSHQWVVSGHWRQQWYPTLGAHQPRWIMPYIKGPEDMPLKPPRAKVFAVVR